MSISNDEGKTRMKKDVVVEEERPLEDGRKKWDLGATSSVKDIAKMEEMEERLEDAGLVKAPDGGYGWGVVLASFCTNAVVDGIIFTVSASLVPRWERFFQNGSVTAVTSLLAGFYLLSGPLASALANNFGCNTVAIAGSLMASVGFLISALLPALPILYFAFGIIGGIGFGLVFLPAIVIVGQYFSEKRALATGIAVCGSGIGTAIFGKLNPFLLDYFDAWAGEEESWRIFLVFLSAVTLLCAIFGYFFKPLKPSKGQLEQVVRITTELMALDENDRPALVTSSEKLAVPSPPRRDSVEEMNQLTHVTQGVEIERFDKPPQNGTLARKRRDTFSQRPFLSTLELLASRQAVDNPSKSNANLALEVSKAGLNNLNRPLSRMDVFYIGSTTSLAHRLERNPKRPTAAAEVETITAPKEGIRSNLYLSSVGLSDAAVARAAAGIPAKWTHGIIASLRPMLDLSLLQSPTFLVLALSGFLTLFCFFVPFAFIGALADDRLSSNKSSPQSKTSSAADQSQNGVLGKAGTETAESNHSQLLLVLLGLFNVFGRVLCGFISDYPMVDPLVVSNLALLVGGAATALVPLSDQLWMFAVFCIPFAFGAASFAALRSIICVELLGIDRLTSAFGMLMLFMGVAALIGPPFAKTLRNYTGDYGLSFHVVGVLMMLSGLVCVPLRRINEWENDKDKQQQMNKNGCGKNRCGVEMEPLNRETNK